MNKATAILAAILAVIVIAGAFTGGFFAGKGRRPSYQRDTVTTVQIIHDTVTRYKPQYITKEIIGERLVPVIDTVKIHDTTFVSLPVEQKVYADSNYRAVVSGIRPQLDEISVFPETRIVTQTVTVTEKRRPTKFGVGVQVGFGGTYGLVHKQLDAGPYVGVGISYNFIRF